MKFERTRNTSKIFVFGVLERILVTILPFIVRTAIIYKMGSEYVGLNSLFTSVLAMLNLADLGISGAVTFCLYKPVAEDDKDTVCALISFLRKTYYAIAAFIILAGICCIPFLDKLIKGDTPSDINIYILFSLYIFNSASSYLFGAYTTIVVDVYQKGDVRHLVVAIIEIVKCSLQIAVICLIQNYYIYTILIPASTVLANIATYLYAKKEFVWCVPKGILSVKIKSVIKKKVTFLFAHRVAASLTNSIDNIVISSSIGLVSVALYGNYSLITSALVGFILVFYSALRPTVGNFFNSETDENKFTLFKALFFLSSWVCIWCTICLACLFQPFMELWVGKQSMLSYPTVIMICLFFFANISRQFFTSIFVEIAGLWNKTLFRQILAALVNLFLDILLVSEYGVAGIVFASFVSTALISLPLDIYVVYKYVLNKKVFEGFKRLFIQIIILVILCIMTYYSCSLISDKGVVAFITKMAICIILPNVLSVFLFCRTKEFAFIKQHVQQVYNK